MLTFSKKSGALRSKSQQVAFVYRTRAGLVLLIYHHGEPFTFTGGKAQNQQDRGKIARLQTKQCFLYITLEFCSCGVWNYEYKWQMLGKSS